jgi:hypothetical protein
MKEQVFCYCDKTDTIRLMPSNYLVAHRQYNRWVCEPDLAVPVDMAVKCFKAIMKHENKYGDGLNLLAAITPNDKPEPLYIVQGILSGFGWADCSKPLNMHDAKKRQNQLYMKGMMPSESRPMNECTRIVPADAANCRYMIQ